MGHREKVMLLRIMLQQNMVPLQTHNGEQIYVKKVSNRDNKQILSFVPVVGMVIAWHTRNVPRRTNGRVGEGEADSCHHVYYIIQGCAHSVLFVSSVNDMPSLCILFWEPVLKWRMVSWMLRNKRLALLAIKRASR